jgi:uncharacterized membrane protein
MFKKYDEEIKKIISDKSSDTDWKKILEKHQRMISHIQHERLIHLIVTMFVGLVMSIGAFIIIITQKPDLLLFVLFLLILFVAYLFHYRFLENTTQNWHEVEEKIISKI